MKRQEILKITTNLKNKFYVDKEMQDIMNEFYQIKRKHNFIIIIRYNFIISIC